MTITANDLKLFAAAYPNDTATGGGRMTANVVQTGVENNVFPDIDAAARASGRVQLRKVFVAVTSADASTLSAAQAGFAAGSTDGGVDVVAFSFGDADTLRPEAMAAFLRAPFQWVLYGGFGVSRVAGQQAKLTMNPTAGGVAVTAPAVGTLVAITGADTFGSPAQVYLATWITESSGTTVTLADPVPASLAGVSLYLHANPDAENFDLSTALPMVSGAMLTATSGGSSVRVNRVMVRIVPGPTVYPSVVTGVGDTKDLRVSVGRVPIFRVGDTVVIRSASISEVAIVSAIDYTGGLSFASPLANSYPSGSVISTLLQFGDLQAAVGPSFTQQTWTRAWSDSILGNPIGLAYNTIAGSITTTNIGAETERWAIVFTSPTAFRLLGEHLGQIATGTTDADFSPLNPITGAPYFTIKKEGWGTGWAIGNVLRFPTLGARAPIWIARCTSPSPAGPVNTPSLEVRGSVNA